MRKMYHLVMLCLSVLAFVGCSKKEENEQETKNPLLGTWRLVETDEGESDVCESKSTISFTETKLTSIDFKDEAGKCIQGENLEVDYKIKEDVIIFTRTSAQQGTQEVSMKFKINGNKLLLEVINSSRKAIYIKK